MDDYDIPVIKNTDCCGCEACVQVCPQKCITLFWDEEGFAYPTIDSTLCISCGKCKKVCPVINSSKLKAEIPLCYIAYHSNDFVRLDSSSGGIFTALAERVLEGFDGIVYGAAFDKDFIVRHIGVNSVNDLDVLRGSKYVQSQIGQTYCDTEFNLKSGRVVLYTGMPCQIAGLKKYLGRDYDKLYTVEMLCHGVPSPIIWRQYLDEQEERYGGKITDVKFRQKKQGWTSFSMRLQFDNSRVYEKVKDKDPYMMLFLQNISLRPSCYYCKFKDINKRVADITIGDCWGVENYMPEMFDDNGTSVVFIHSSKGKRLFDEIRKRLIIRVGEVDKSVSPQAESRMSPFPHSKRQRYLELVKEGENVRKMAKLAEHSLFGRIEAKMIRILKIERYCKNND